MKGGEREKRDRRKRGRKREREREEEESVRKPKVYIRCFYGHVPVALPYVRNPVIRIGK